MIKILCNNCGYIGSVPIINRGYNCPKCKAWRPIPKDTVICKCGNDPCNPMEHAGWSPDDR